MDILLSEIPIVLLHESGVFLPNSRTLVLADIHLGKSATFRTRGIPVPEGDTASDLFRITELIEKYNAKQLVIAGDLVHAEDGLTEHTVSLLKDWLKTLEIPVILTEGNHDKKSRLPSLDLEIVESCVIDGILITHDPRDLADGRAGIAGHLHPSYLFRESARVKMSLRGFYLKQSQHLILPAFSPFTGTHPITPSIGDQFFSITQNKLHEIQLMIGGQKL
jgi:DNA ligase-associated metallophosphoesterase